MICPVCKYDNKPGVTHCGMCYEVFNRSAAQSYLQAVKRERQREEGDTDEPEVVIRSQNVVNESSSPFAKADWAELVMNIASLVMKFKNALLIGAGAVVLWLLVTFLFSADLWYHLAGNKFTYSVPNGAPVTYLVGMNQSVRIWSERGGRLDTPMEEFKIDEIGNVLMETQKKFTKKQKVVQVVPQEWIQIYNDASGTISRAIPKKHPSLANGQLVFDNRGTLLERAVSASPRLGKSLPFLAPRFPKGSLRRDLTWNESVGWTDIYNDWRIDWTGTLHWKLGDLIPCREGHCAQLTYTAELHPQLSGWPSWAKGAIHGTYATLATEGEAIFDVSNHRMVANTFSYEGLLHIPIIDLVRIPWELRIGRRVKGVAGEIVLRFINKINIQKK